MATLEEVYRKFGETAEAAQLLETELGTMLLLASAVEELDSPEPVRLRDLLAWVDRQTLGQLLKKLKGRHEALDALELLLWNALQERNRLLHSFYRQHNFRRNSDEGRAIMLEDLNSIHTAVLEAFKAVIRLGGVDLNALSADGPAILPTRHVPI